MMCDDEDERTLSGVEELEVTFLDIGMVDVPFVHSHLSAVLEPPELDAVVVEADEPPSLGVPTFWPNAENDFGPSIRVHVRQQC